MTTRTRITVIDYEMGNLASVKCAFERLDGCEVELTSSPKGLRDADCIVLPGVGAFADAMTNLTQFGLVDELHEQVLHRRKPFLGICLGMQLVSEESDEGGRTRGLGWIPGRVERLKGGPQHRVPHVGWNEVEFSPSSPFFQGLSTDRYFYFVHSYVFRCAPESVLAACEYDAPFTAAIHRDNIVATQFHPERSHQNGKIFLQNFLSWARGRIA